MKLQYLTIILFISILTGNLVAQNNDVYFHQTRCNYLNCLKSTNNGVVSSTLINLIQLKKRYPQADYCSICPVLDSLTIYGHTDRIKNLSKIVLAYYQHQLDLDWLAKHNYLKIYAYLDLLFDDKIMQTVMYHTK